MGDDRNQRESERGAAAFQAVDMAAEFKLVGDFAAGIGLCGGDCRVQFVQSVARPLDEFGAQERHHVVNGLPRCLVSQPTAPAWPNPRQDQPCLPQQTYTEKAKIPLKLGAGVVQPPAVPRVLSRRLSVTRWAAKSARSPSSPVTNGGVPSRADATNAVNSSSNGSVSS